MVIDLRPLRPGSGPKETTETGSASHAMVPRTNAAAIIWNDRQSAKVARCLSR